MGKKAAAAESVARGVLGICIVGTIGAAFGSMFLAESTKQQEAHFVYAKVVQPRLNKDCAPEGPVDSNKYRDDSVNVVLATKLLLRHPEKMKDICAVVNANSTRRENREAMVDLATSLGVDTSVFKTRHHFEPVVMVNELGPEAFK